MKKRFSFILSIMLLFALPLDSFASGIVDDEGYNNRVDVEIYLSPGVDQLKMMYQTPDRKKSELVTLEDVKGNSAKEFELYCHGHYSWVTYAKGKQKNVFGITINKKTSIKNPNKCTADSRASEK